MQLSLSTLLPPWIRPSTAAGPLLILPLQLQPGWLGRGNLPAEAGVPSRPR